MKKKSKDQRWRWICVGSLLLASLNGNLEASGLSHPNVNPVEVSQATRKLRGTILDTNGTPVIGASISVKGTTTGTISDMNGVFTLDVKNGDVLEISFIGYLSHTVKVGTQTDLQIVLKEDTQALDEVVVVGYGVQKKSVMTAAISRVTSDDLEEAGADPGRGCVTRKSLGSKHYAEFRTTGSRVESPYPWYRNYQ